MFYDVEPRMVSANKKNHNTLLEKTVHFSLLITIGAGCSSQWHNPFVFFSSSHKKNFSAISIRTYLQCCQGTDFLAAELNRDPVKICVVEKLKGQFSLDMPKKGRKAATFQKKCYVFFYQEQNCFEENFDQVLATLITRDNKSFPPAIANIHSEPI
jgi:hypothetical protein